MGTIHRERLHLFHSLTPTKDHVVVSSLPVETITFSTIYLAYSIVPSTFLSYEFISLFNRA
ncbi:uncharacterized protein BO66DRAFT_390628 [Aspergillus aculeatinus CBS 121060]|uniref:Uncharacterized protein n=1 Tax=Aspergillus aculeatinus CBS 121060 TaxID=1448322 RepID=A0ACD1HDC3_9EURO|nr:hypothetical protein BO66DRAFT_390628 [Aspergillus aculeatinus CBS 121060]RAH71781.1 hypothetical protein BO66DRAFT_390628 [Aspergillus aculeatinus CBS 121060]